MALEPLSSGAIGVPARPSPGSFLPEGIANPASRRPETAVFHDLSSLKTLSLRPPLWILAFLSLRAPTVFTCTTDELIHPSASERALSSDTSLG